MPAGTDTPPIAPGGRRRPRTGMSLVEALVGMAIAMSLFYVIQNLMYKGSSLLENSHKHLEAATGAQLLIERIHADVRRLVPGDPFLTSGAEGPPVSFRILDAAGAEQTIDYALQPGPSPGTFKISRNGNTLGAVTLKEAVIRAMTVAGADGRQIYGVQTILLATDAHGKKEFPLVDFTAVDVETLRPLDPYWIPN